MPAPSKQSNRFARHRLLSPPPARHPGSHAHRSRVLSRLLALAVVATAVSAVLLSGVASPSLESMSAVSAGSASAAAGAAGPAGLNPLDVAYYPKLQREQADAQAAAAIQSANALIARAPATVDTVPVTSKIASLSNYSLLDVGTVIDLTKDTETTLVQTTAAVEAANRAAAAAKAAAAEALRVANTVAGAKATARSLAASQYGWGDSQFQCLSSLWQKESGWSYSSSNSSSGAGGIPQALPASKMSVFGADWATNATTQIRWGLDYISRSYGSPCAAWAHSTSVNWY